MTEFLVVLGIVGLVGAVALGIRFHQQVASVFRWTWNSLLFFISAAHVALRLCIVFAAMFLVIMTFMLQLVAFMLIVCIMCTALLLYVPVWLVALALWATSRKRTAFDKANKPANALADRLCKAADGCIGASDTLFDALETSFDAAERALDSAAPRGEVFARPFLRLSRRVWPRD